MDYGKLMKLAGIEGVLEESVSIVDKLEGAKRSLEVAMGNHESILVNAFRVSGEEHKISHIEIGFSDCMFMRNGDIRMVFEDCVVVSDYGEEEMDKLSVDIRGGKVVPLW